MNSEFDFPTGRTVHGLPEYSLDGVRFLHRPGREGIAFFFSAFERVGDPQSYHYINSTTQLPQHCIFVLDEDAPVGDPRGSYFIGRPDDPRYLAALGRLAKRLISRLAPLAVPFLVGSSKGGVGALLTFTELGYGNVLANAPQLLIDDYLSRFSDAQAVRANLGGDGSVGSMALDGFVGTRFEHLTEGNLPHASSVILTCGVEDLYHLDHARKIAVLAEGAGIPFKLIPVRGGHDGRAIVEFVELMNDYLSYGSLGSLANQKLIELVFSLSAPPFSDAIGADYKLIPELRSRWTTWRPQSVRDDAFFRFVKSHSLWKAKVDRSGCLLVVDLPEYEHVGYNIYATTESGRVLKTDDYQPCHVIVVETSERISRVSIFMQAGTQRFGVGDLTITEGDRSAIQVPRFEAM